ncbi:M20/M25/M40 family metallo-hydrolase [Desertivirga xinjiangensis]|uniref:M20/M25/M40 family metallo-hydrolase n=1 Tax=Desertivirga xinjiangensis TaxID=539206 RepID=UPI00210E520E|nr:M20/M25/M40 family metallo-hydrolase [Pedobacter xinjiangensis]
MGVSRSKKQFIQIICMALLVTSCAVKQPLHVIRQNDIERVIRILAADDMQGRGLSGPGIEKAATFIEKEFGAIGLQTYKGSQSFRQEFPMNRIAPGQLNVKINGSPVENQDVFIVSDVESLDWRNSEDTNIQYIRSGQSFIERYKEIMQLKTPALVYVDRQFFDSFKRFRTHYMQERIVQEPAGHAAVFILGESEMVSCFEVSYSNVIKKETLFNVAGIIPGKSRSKELVIFSGHYDHLGIVQSSAGDSIANGADDDASGITAVISLARYYKNLNNNERTLVFVAFTAEEAGLKGSEYFSKQINPEEVIAMFNIEMIGKESKFGKNAAFITGFERSDFGRILQTNLKGSTFRFYPDPYPQQQLFYRSDNASLAALGVPAHTISTDQIDTDRFYHTVDDEIETLDMKNILSTIKAIAVSSQSIISGQDTPKRITKIQNE